MKIKKNFLGKIALLFCTALSCFAIGFANMSIVAKANETPLFSIVDGASVRIEEPYGMRFSADYSKTLFNQDGTLKEGYEAGILLIQTEELNGELVIGTAGAKNVTAMVWDTEKGAKDHYRLNAVMSNIPETEFDTYVTARAYLKQGTEVSYSGTQTRNVAQVASRAMADGYTGTVIENYINKVNPSITLPTEVDSENTVTLSLGQSVSFAVAPEYLTATLSFSANDIVNVENTTLTAVKAGETDVSIQLGTLVKTMHINVVAPAMTNRTASSAFDFTFNGENISYITKSASFATFDGVSVAQGSVSSTLVYDKSEATRTGLIFKGSFENNMTNLEDSTAEYGAWATGVGAQYYMFYIEMQSGTLLLYKTTGQAGMYIEITPIEKAGEAYRNKFNAGETEFELKATYCLNENGGLIIKLYIDNELQLWFEDASPLQGSSVGICSTKANTEFKDVAFDNTVTKEMGSPIITMQTAFTVSKGANGEYNTYKGWQGVRSTAYLDDVLLDRNIGATGTLTTNIVANNTKSAIVLFASTNANAITGLNGVHFVLEPTEGGYLIYVGCIRDGNWVNGEMGADATAILIPTADVFGVEVKYAVNANGDIQFTYAVTVGESTYVRTALWPTSWDADAFWSRNNFANAVAIWQEAGGKAVTFGDVEYVGDLAISALNAKLDKTANASGTVEMDVTLGGTNVGIAMFGEVTLLSTHKYKGVVCYIKTDGAVSLVFVNEGNAPTVLTATASVNVSKQMHVVYSYSIDGNGICTYSVTITQEGEAPVTMNFEATTAPIGNYWNQNSLGDGILVFYPLTAVGQPKVENVVYTQK